MCEKYWNTFFLPSASFPGSAPCLRDRTQISFSIPDRAQLPASQPACGFHVFLSFCFVSFRRLDFHDLCYVREFCRSHLLQPRANVKILEPLPEDELINACIAERVSSRGSRHRRFVSPGRYLNKASPKLNCLPCGRSLQGTG
jgi:hypothetical protein